MTSESPESAPSPSAAAEFFSRRRVAFVLLVLLVEIGIYFAGLFTPMSDAARQQLANQTSTQFGNFRSGSPAGLTAFIFTHNLTIALFEMIPVAGAFLFGFSVYGTGLAAQALVAYQGLPVQWGAVIFAFPYSLVELTAYALAVVSGFALVAAWRKRRLRREAKVFMLEGIAVAGILLVAASMEAATVGISPVLGFALWLPTGLVIAGGVLLARRTRG
ncbi:MAG: stage II sporulation protein M [Nitrososphaerota archaeon]|nr:stage II sporulation protein M [Nitrososphaerota archaeon]